MREHYQNLLKSRSDFAITNNSERTYYSLHDLLELADIENRMFRMLNVSSVMAEVDGRQQSFASRASQWRGGDDVSQRPPETFYKYVQIKRRRYDSGSRRHNLLQIIDISSEIMYNVAQGEKKLLQLINATVSHEMRNPTNSIRCQNLQ